MAYNPYTPTSLNKDFYEEYNGNDLIFRYTIATGEVDFIEERTLSVLGLRPPSDKWGIPLGAPYDIYKMCIAGNNYTADTVNIFTNINSGFLRAFKGGFIANLVGKITYPPGVSAPLYVCGKVLRVEFIPLSDGSQTNSVIITSAIYL